MYVQLHNLTAPNTVTYHRICTHTHGIGRGYNYNFRIHTLTWSGNRLFRSFRSKFTFVPSHKHSSTLTLYSTAREDPKRRIRAPQLVDTTGLYCRDRFWGGSNTKFAHWSTVKRHARALGWVLCTSVCVYTSGQGRWHLAAIRCDISIHVFLEDAS